MSLESLKLFLGVTWDDEDTRLQQMLDACTATAERYCQRKFSSQEHTVFLDGNGSQVLYLPEHPLTAIGGVWVSPTCYGGAGNPDAFDAATEWALNTDFVVKSLAETEANRAALYGLRSLWPTGIANIKVAFTAGYTTLPDDLQQAIYQLVAQVRHGAQQGQVLGNASLGDYSYSVLRRNSPEIADAKRVLNHYSREVI